MKNTVTKKNGGKKSTKKIDDPNSEIAKRWHSKLANQWVPVPHFFIENYHLLDKEHGGLTHGEAMFIIHLMKFKWDEKHPYPSYKTLAKSMNITDRSVRRFSERLEGRKLLYRQIRIGNTNIFDLSPLMTALVNLQTKQEKLK